MTKRKQKSKQRRRQSNNNNPRMNDLMVKSGQIQYGTTSANGVPLHLFNLKQVTTGITSSVAGVISVDLSINNPSGATDWITGVSQLFDSYRVKRVILTWIPANPNDATSTFRPLYVITDFDSATVGVTTGDQALQFDSTRIYDASKPFVHKVMIPFMAQANSPLGWTDVAAPMAQGSLQIFGTGFSNSTTYGSYIMQYEIVTKLKR